jgi:hypothetical protein
MIDFGAALRKAGLMAACVALMALAGCKAPALDPETDTIARAVYSDLRTHSPALKAKLSPELLTPQTDAEIAKVEVYLPPGEPSLGKAVSWNYVSMTGQGKTALLSHEYDYPGKVVLAKVWLKRSEGAKAWTVTGFNVQTATTQDLKALEFRLIGKSPAHYLFLAGMVASLGLMLAAMVKVVRTKGLKRKWLWLIASLFCVIGFQINWFSGALTWKLNFGLINAGAVTASSRFDPWVLFFSLPLGAILILVGVWAKPKTKPALDEAF